jgi:hypothetical protein
MSQPDNGRHAQLNISTEQKQQGDNNHAQDDDAGEHKSRHAPVPKGREAAGVMVSAHSRNVSPNAVTNATLARGQTRCATSPLSPVETAVVKKELAKAVEGHRK